MWGESTSTVSNLLYESSGRVLAFLGAPIVSDSRTGSGSGTTAATTTTAPDIIAPERSTTCRSPDSAVAAAHLQLLRSVKALLDQGTCFHVLCQSNCSRELLLSAGVERDRFTLLNPLRKGTQNGTGQAGLTVLDPERDDSDPDPEQAVVNALDMARALTSRASVVLALDVDFSAFPATELCSQCCAEGGQVHIIGNTQRSIDTSALEARDVLSPDGPRPPNILHRFGASTFLSAILQDHFSIHVPSINLPPWTSPSNANNSGRPMPSKTENQQSERSELESVQNFQAVWWNICQREKSDDSEPFEAPGDILVAADSGAIARSGVDRGISTQSILAAPVVPALKLSGPKISTQLGSQAASSQRIMVLKKEKKSSKHGKSRKKKKSGKRKEGRSSTAALSHLQRRLRIGLGGLRGPSPLKSREELLDVLTDLHLIQPPPSHRRLQKNPELGRSLVAVVTSLNDALDADAIQIVESATLLINRWKKAIAVESGVATSESVFGHHDQPEHSVNNVDTAETASMVSSKTTSQLRETSVVDFDDIQSSDSRQASDCGGPDAPIARKQFLPDPTAAATAAKLALEATAAAEAAVRRSQHSPAMENEVSSNAQAAANSAASALLFAPREPAASSPLSHTVNNTAIVVSAAQVNQPLMATSERNEMRVHQPVISPSDSGPSTDRDFEPVRPCRLFIMGLCSAGVNCAFRHDIDSRAGNKQDILSVEAVTDESGDEEP